MWTVVRLPLLAALVAALVGLVAVLAMLARDEQSYSPDDEDAAWQLVENRHEGPICARDVTLFDDHEQCETFGVGDVDGDGVLDCWIAVHEVTQGKRALTVWRSCAEGSGTTVDAEFDAVITLPPELGDGVWPRWVAHQLVGRDVQCSDPADIAAGCAPPDAAWRWTLAVPPHLETGFYSLDAVHPPEWQTGAPPVIDHPRALVAGVLPAAWHGEHQHAEDDRFHSYGVPGVHIIVAQASRDATVRCGGVDVSVVSAGLVASDKIADRWAWLLYQPSDTWVYVEHLICVDDVVLAYAEHGSSYAIVDPRSGGWYVPPPPSDTEVTPRLLDFGDGEHELNGMPTSDWLATPPTPPEPPDSDAEPPDLSPLPVDHAVVSGDQSGASGDWEEPQGTQAACDDWRCAQPEHQLACAGRDVTWSRHGVRAARGRTSQWLDLAEDDDHGSYRITDVRCRDNARLVISRRHVNDLIEAEPAVRDEAVVDFRRHTWSVR